MQEIDQSDEGLLLRLARQCVYVLFMRHLKHEEESIFEQLKEVENDSETLKGLSKDLRSIPPEKIPAHPTNLITSKLKILDNAYSQNSQEGVC